MLFMYMYVHTFVHSCRLVRLPLCAFCPLCLSLQSCEDGGGPNVFGIASVDSAKMGDMTVLLSVSVPAGLSVRWW